MITGTNTINKNKLISSSTHKNFKSSSVVGTGSGGTFLRNGEHTQSIKLIRENFASLFLGSKRNGSNGVNNNNGGNGSGGNSNGSSVSNLHADNNSDAEKMVNR